ncbi:S8 family serine peptidase [Micromonospora craniellae]|uniref:Type VII secretion-associated serine protease mycosin n=1 Tax=Micromonospora craniellae TaxID=2294034 RepID=A0A372FXP0_9ACTN|nr:S8 family serine peptidase [Micromonospora craniellae]RFS45567.1 type VII secretion-associated serine protease mycosin [Micromonospora craniellae]
MRAGRRRLGVLFASGLVAFALPPVAGPAAAVECLPAARTHFADLPWPQERLAAERAWSYHRGDGVVVAVLDTGVSRAAPALAGRVLPGRDVRSGGRADSDCAGHGTFVAGLIAASQRRGTGFAGVAPGVRILPIRVADRFDDVHPDLLASGVEAAITGGASIIVVVPSAPFGSPALSRAVEQAERRNRLLIAGSSTHRAEGVAHPAALAGVLSVAAIGRNGAGLSAPVQGAGRLPDLAAPGADVVSIAPLGVGHLTASARCLATGFVAGTAALVRGYHPGLDAAQVRARLVATADPAPPSARPSLGAGVVNPLAAVTSVAPVRPDPVGTDTAGRRLPELEPALPGTVPQRPDGMAVSVGVAVAAVAGAVATGVAMTAVGAARRRRDTSSG